MTIEQIFDSFGKLRVLIIGDVMLDSYIWGAVERISPEAPVPVINVKKKDFRLGGAANVALNVLALGAKPILCALIGNDDDGKKLTQRLDEQGMSKDGIVVSNERPTTVKTRVIASHQHVVRVDEESDREPSEREGKLILEKIERLLPQSDVVVFEDYDKGVLCEKIIAKTVELANKQNIPTVVDPKKRNFLSYKNVTLFKPNLKELREGLKLEVSTGNQDQVQQATSMLKEKLQAKGIMVTLSEHGVYIDYQNQKVKLPAHEREIADVSGAGDTVVSVAALCTALNLDARMIAFLSNLAGGLVCQHVGVVPIDKGELYEEALKELPN
ncbi:MAG: D-glycero-beta-D-manno-heptose-7-phosphate kinase [Bacteroidetes bacterium]|nr:D-glycero-beta-D-manno-heptose-7-phosphate kinase [Bacteroidota bacterium]MBI3482721.1 D-glycero-beta-D-manno-heptose-7-phosphate kinase [Bacteroidota bacterium]